MKQRNTIQKQIIRQALMELDHPTAEEVYAYMHEAHPTISKATFYRNLKSMADEGSALRVDIPGQATHFDDRLESHGHAVCDVCGMVFDIEMKQPTMKGIDRIVKDDNGFRIESANIFFSGTCPNCQRRRKKNERS